MCCCKFKLHNKLLLIILLYNFNAVACRTKLYCLKKHCIAVITELMVCYLRFGVKAVVFMHKNRQCFFFIFYILTLCLQHQHDVFICLLILHRPVFIVCANLWPMMVLMAQVCCNETNPASTRIQQEVNVIELINHVLMCLAEFTRL